MVSDRHSPVFAGRRAGLRDVAADGRHLGPRRLAMAVPPGEPSLHSLGATDAEIARRSSAGGALAHGRGARCADRCAGFGGARAAAFIAAGCAEGPAGLDLHRDPVRLHARVVRYRHLAAADAEGISSFESRHRLDRGDPLSVCFARHDPVGAPRRPEGEPHRQSCARMPAWRHRAARADRFRLCCGSPSSGSASPSSE